MDNQNIAKQFYELGLAFYQNGDYSSAFTYFQKGAELGNAVCMYNLRILYGSDALGPKNMEQAFLWVKKAAEAGNVGAYDLLAEMYKAGEGTTKDLVEALRWASAYCAFHESEEATQRVQDLTNMLQLEGTSKTMEEYEDLSIECMDREDYEGAIPYLLKGASLGSGVCAHNLSYVYGNGYGVKQDEEMAFSWMKKAVECGNEESYFGLPTMYFNGNGVEEDYDQAFYWADMALKNCEEDEQDALEMMQYIQSVRIENAEESQVAGAVELEKGFASAQNGDNDGAFQLFLAGAKLGNPTCMYNVAEMSRIGSGTEQNLEDYFYWMKESANDGCLRADYSLANVYMDGEMTPIDLEEAARYVEAYEQITGVEYEEAKALRDKLKTLQDQAKQPAIMEMTSEDYLVRAEECRKKVMHDGMVLNYQRAADLGNAEGMYQLGLCLWNGRYVEKDQEQGLEWLKKAADLKHGNAYCQLACISFNNKDLEMATMYANRALQLQCERKQDAEEVLQKIDRIKNPTIGDQRNECRVQGAKKKRAKDYEGAFEWFQRGAQLGDAECIYELGYAYHMGNGVERDDVKAFAYTKQAAEAGWKK